MKLVAGKSLSGVAAGMAALSLFVSGVVLTSAPVMVSPDRTDASSGSEAATKRAVQEAVAKLPLAFEPNRGQTDGRVDFLARGPGYSAFLTPSQAILKVSRPSAGQESVLRMQLVGSNPDAKAAGRNVLRGKVNYLKGPQSNWVKNVPTFSKVRYSNVYPGIDLAYYGNQRNLEYDFIVKPGADPSRAKLLFEGADSVVRRSNGDLAVTVGDETFVQRRPYAYQDNGGARKEIPSAFRVKGTTVTFDLGRYDTTRTLVIDPIISYSTFMGGAGADVGFGVAVDGAGNAYLTGSTTSAKFPCGTLDPPACPPATDPPTELKASYQDRRKLLDAFVVKVDTNAAGFNSLVWSTYLGGDGDDVGFDVAVDDKGNVYVAGATQSSDDPGTAAVENGFPTTANGHDTTCGTDGHCNAPLPDSIPFLAVEGTTPTLYQCYPHTAPGTTQTDCPTSPIPDGFVSKLNPTGTGLKYSTFLGGSDFEHEPNPAAGALGHMDIAVVGTKAFVASTTASSDFPTTANGDQSCGTGGEGCEGRTDGFLSVLETHPNKIAQSGKSLLLSTFIGGDAADVAKGVAVDGDGDAYVVGTTHGNPPGSPVVNDFPTTNAQGYFGGASDGFVAKLGTGKLIKDKPAPLFSYARYLGGGGADEVWDVALHGKTAYATGFTDSGDDPKTAEADGPQPYFPTTPGAYDTSFNGEATSTEEPTNSFLNGDAFMTKLTASGHEVAYSTYLGGIHGDVGHGIAVDSAGAAYVTGYTMCKNQTPGSTSCDAPVPNGSFPTRDATQPVMGGNHLGSELHNSPTDGFASKLDPAGGGDSDLIFSTYVGGNNFDRGYAIALRETDLGKEIYVTGRTGSTDYRLFNAFTTKKPSGRGNRDAYLMKITL